MLLNMRRKTVNRATTKGVVYNVNPRHDRSITFMEYDPDLSYKSEGDNNMTLIIGDNIQTLATLSTTHKGKVGLIINDIPYTSKSMSYDKDALDEQTQEEYWANTIYDVTAKCKDLLAEDGVIIQFCGDDNISTMIQIMDRLFGSDNRIQRIYAPINSMDHILVYSKNRILFTKNAGLWNFEEKDPTWHAMIRTTGGRIGSKEQCSTRKVLGRKFTPPKGYIWWIDRSKMKELEAKGEVRLNKNGVPECLLKTGRIFSQPSTVITKREHQTGTANNSLKAVFGEQPIIGAKSPYLIQDLISYYAKPGCIVLDAFLGTGTTGVAVAMENKSRLENHGISDPIQFIGITHDAYPVDEANSKKIYNRKIGSQIAAHRLKVTLSGKGYLESNERSEITRNNINNCIYPAFGGDLNTYWLQTSIQVDDFEGYEEDCPAENMIGYYGFANGIHTEPVDHGNYVTVEDDKKLIGVFKSYDDADNCHPEYAPQLYNYLHEMKERANGRKLLLYSASYDTTEPFIVEGEEIIPTPGGYVEQLGRYYYSLKETWTQKQRSLIRGEQAEMFARNYAVLNDCVEALGMIDFLEEFIETETDPRKKSQLKTIRMSIKAAAKTIKTVTDNHKIVKLSHTVMEG